MFSCDYGAKKYADEIRENAECFGVKPAVLFAVAETESGFDPQAKSLSGAIGIMQIMPKTGEWIASVLSVEGYSETLLYDPEINICFGAYYLSYLYSIFHSDWIVFAAYNAGETVVKAWLAVGIDSEEDIPYPETKRYVGKVKRAVSHYEGKKFLSFD